MGKGCSFAKGGRDSSDQRLTHLEDFVAGQVLCVHEFVGDKEETKKQV